jgi:CRISPR-associated protein Csc1
MSIHIARCRMTLHDYLYYASREFGRFYETEKYLHNYGLTYALGLVQPAPAYANHSSEPAYEEELHAERVSNCYVTPASPLHVDFSFHTFKMASVPYYSITPKESRNRALFGRAKELAPGSVFEFFIFAEEEKRLPVWIRLGKWMAKAEVIYEWYTVGTDKVKVVEPRRSQLVHCPVNPLDIAKERLASFDIIVMPPVSILTNVRVTGSCYELAGSEKFHDKKDARWYIPAGMSFFNREAIVQ